PGRGRPADGVGAEHRVELGFDRPVGGFLERASERLGPAAPHRAEVDERAVLVEDDEVDAVKTDGHTSAPTSELGVAASSRAAPRTNDASGGNEIVTGCPTSGTLRWGSLKESSATIEGGSPPASSPRRTRMRTIEPRKLTSSTVPVSRLGAGAPSPNEMPSGRRASVPRPSFEASVATLLARISWPSIDNRPVGASITPALTRLSV